MFRASRAYWDNPPGGCGCVATHIGATSCRCTDSCNRNIVFRLLCCKLQCYKTFSRQRVMTSVYAREGRRFHSDDVKRTLNLCCATSRSCSARATACCADSSCPAAPAEAASAWAARWTASSARSWAATTSCAALLQLHVFQFLRTRYVKQYLYQRYIKSEMQPLIGVRQRQIR